MTPLRPRAPSALAAAASLALTAAGCAGAPPPAAPARPTPQALFQLVAPSVVAILNDDRADRDAEAKELEKTMGDESRAPKHVIDVSLRKEPTPHGTGFMIEGGQIATAAHVVFRPDRLKITTRAGETVDAEVVRIDEVRDVAILKPKTPLRGVPPLPLDARSLAVGEPVWALGHTGQGVWALSWGMSEGIASGVVDMFGAKLLLFDAAVYPGFSGGPVVTIGADGKPAVVGVNHAILFTGPGGTPIASISSAVSVGEVREVIAGHPPTMEKVVADYANKQRMRSYADIFITDRLSVGRDPGGQQVAHIFGNAKTLETDKDSPRIPCVAMMFGVPAGDQTVSFEAQDIQGKTLVQKSTSLKIDGGQRVAFASASLLPPPGTRGKIGVVAKLGGKELGRTSVHLDVQGDDEDLHEEHDADSSDDGYPDVDIVVAQLANDDPLMLGGIRAGWSERSYPRRVGFTWFARGTRGWSGTNASITAFVLDESGHIVGRSDGCFQPELRPERTWSCVNSGGMQSPPMPSKTGHYDIVFAINDRPVAWWPMEAALRKEDLPGSDIDRWLQEMKRIGQKPPPSKPAPAKP